RNINKHTHNTFALSALLSICIFKINVVLLQETHISKSGPNPLNIPEFPHFDLANYNSKQRGVVNLINRRVQFTSKGSLSDPEGRYIIINRDEDMKGEILGLQDSKA
uniref:Uncharacterized protein n=1 Tax=Kryptolebias marmoratus TaxID=37003 RepID=A0A3Q3APC1_KRYMA